MLSQRWMDDTQAQIDRMLAQKDTLEKDTFVELTTSLTMAIQFLVVRLAAAGIPFRLLNLGAGVWKITTKALDVCPKCKGSGRV